MDEQGEGIYDPSRQEDHCEVFDTFGGMKEGLGWRSEQEKRHAFR